MEEALILVDENDSEIGSQLKMAVHQNGLLHRAFSIFIFNTRGELLLQKRAVSKYHSGGLWTNTCCGHQRLGESLEQSARRRLIEEMGIDCELKKRFGFIYKVPLDNDLTEHEYDHIFFGNFEGEPRLNPIEADDSKWLMLEEIKEDIEKNPTNYTHWFKLIMSEQFEKLMV